MRSTYISSVITSLNKTKKGGRRQVNQKKERPACMKSKGDNCEMAGSSKHIIISAQDFNQTGSSAKYKNVRIHYGYNHILTPRYE